MPAKNCRRKQTAFSFYPTRFNSMSMFFILFPFCIFYSTFIKDYCALRTFSFSPPPFVFLLARKIPGFLAFMSSIERFREIGINSWIFPGIQGKACRLEKPCMREALSRWTQKKIARADRSELVAVKCKACLEPSANRSNFFFVHCDESLRSLIFMSLWYSTICHLRTSLQ